MDFRTFVSLAVVLLLVVNATLLVLGQSNPPPCEGQGLPQHIPGQIPCPRPANQNCDLGGYMWEHSGTMWIIWSCSMWDPGSESSFGRSYHRPSNPFERLF